MQIHGKVDAGCSQAVCKIYVPDGNVPSSPSQVPIPNLSRGENLALQHRRIIGAVRIAHNPRYGIVRRIRPLPRFFAARPFLYKAFYNGVGGGAGS